MNKPNWISQIKFLCFDVDGTLYRHVPAAWEAIQSQIYGVVMEHRKCSLAEAEKYFRRRYQELGSSTKVLNELGIVSNNSLPIVSKKLDAIGIPLNLFNPIVTTYELGVMKPDPDPFLKSLELVAVSPIEAVYIGDSEETDILGAKAVGMKTIMVWDESQEADLSIPTIYNLEELFLKSKQNP